MVIVPTVWALFVVPDLFQSIAAAPSDAILKGMIYGFIWGIGGVLFGMSIKFVGVSLTYGVVMGTTGAIGALVPLFQMDSLPPFKGLLLIIIGVVVMMAGVVLIAWAGIKREKLQAQSDDKIEGIKSGKEFRKGIVLVSISGVFSAFINIGYANAAPIGKSAELFGASPINSGFAAWVVVLWGAILFNVIYSVVLLTKNKTWQTFLLPGTQKAYKWAILSALLWFGSLGIYGIGAAKMGEFGTVIGWPVFVGLSLVFSNYWAIRYGEWKGAEKYYKILIPGVAVLILATIILAIA